MTESTSTSRPGAKFPVPKGLTLSEGAYTFRVVSVTEAEPFDDGRARWLAVVEYQGNERELMMSDTLYRRIYELMNDTDTVQVLVTGSGRDVRYAVSGA